MNLFEELFLNVILITFPILVYFICSCYHLLRKEKYNDLLLGLLLVSSLYIFLKYGKVVNDNKILLFCNIPIIFAFLKKKGYLAIILSLFVIGYCHYVFDYNVIIMSIKFLVYYLAYIVFNKQRVSDNDFVAIFASIQGFFIAFEYFFINNVDDVNTFIAIFLITFLFYIITFILLYLSNIVSKITNLFYEVKELEKEKEIKNSLFKLTHEIKNPIAVCKGYLDMLDIDDYDKLNRYIPIIKQEINRSLNIMSDFLEFSKIKINKDIVDINVLLDDVYDSFKILNKNKNIELVYNEKEEEICIEADYDRLKQVLLNLMKNSSEAITKNGRIILDSKIDGKNCIITIEDNGIGMSSETLKEIKTLFFTTKKDGSGIGVSLSNEIIKAHGGQLNYFSTYGKGTKVQIQLPYHEICD